MTRIYPEQKLEYDDTEPAEPPCCWLCPNADTEQCATCPLPEQEQYELERGEQREHFAFSSHGIIHADAAGDGPILYENDTRYV